ncbi:hypothetical protein H4582DRAFT_2022043 [Lactarius indigo]|nr:hypothetical protein H4582DRAFT_2022043 [Lactarius indigo]
MSTFPTPRLSPIPHIFPFHVRHAPPLFPPSSHRHHHVALRRKRSCDQFSYVSPFRSSTFFSASRPGPHMIQSLWPSPSLTITHDLLCLSQFPTSCFVPLPLCSVPFFLAFHLVRLSLAAPTHSLSPYRSGPGYRAFPCAHTTSFLLNRSLRRQRLLP